MTAAAGWALITHWAQIRPDMAARCAEPMITASEGRCGGGITQPRGQLRGAPKWSGSAAFQSAAQPRGAPATSSPGSSQSKSSA
jgi:hypothetical protein